MMGHGRGKCFVQPGFLLQTVMMPAVLLHCHGPLRAVLATGSGWVNCNESPAAVPVSARTAITSAIFFRFHKVRFDVPVAVGVVVSAMAILLLQCDENRSAGFIVM